MRNYEPAQTSFDRLRTLLLLTLCCMGFSHATVAADAYSGKVAVITGASSGLGAELAKIAAAKRMKLVLADIQPASAQTFAKEVNAKNGEAIAVEADLSKADQRARVIDAAMKRFGRIDYLFNNAGYSYVATLEQMDLADAHRLFEVNYWAYVDLAQRAIAIMKPQRSGTIVNIASILGHSQAPRGMGHYAATKHALVGLFQTAAAEVKPDGIKIFIASPGGMRTNIGRNAVGPMADSWRHHADSWEEPAIPARDIFEMIQGDQVIFHPGYQGKR